MEYNMLLLYRCLVITKKYNYQDSEFPNSKI